MGAVAAVGSAPPFVARRSQLEHLSELMAQACSGAATCVIIGGDAGVGKTRLITEIAARAGTEGFAVLTGRCVDLATGALPYLPFAEALSTPLRASGTVPAQTRLATLIRESAQKRAGLAQILGTGEDQNRRSPEDVGLDRLALFESVVSMIELIAAEVAPLLLVLEDLHWADASTRDLVRFLFSRLGPDRVLILASYRKDDLHRRHPLRPLLGELVRLPRVELMDLPPMSQDELGELLSGLTGEPVNPDRLQAISVRSCGNPYYAQELIDSGADGQLPGELTDLLLDRLAQLSEPAQQIVRLASTMGSARIDDLLLRTVAAGADGESDAVQIESALREAIARQVLVPEALDRYRFRHALLQEAVYADLLPGERVRLHRNVAAGLLRLAGAGGKLAAAEMARHSLAANDLPGALNASLQAARQASMGSAPAEALQHYEQALQLWDVVPAERHSERWPRSLVSLRAAEAARDAGLGHRSVALARTAVEEAEGSGDFGAAAGARAALALHTYLVEKPHEAYDHATRVISDLAAADDPMPARALAWSMIARVHLGLGRPAEATTAVLPGLTEAQRLGMTALQVELLTTQAVAEGMLGRHEDSAQSFRLARAAAELAGDVAGAVRVLNNIAINALDEGDLAAGIEHLRAAIAAADAGGLAAGPSGSIARELLIITYWRTGDVDGALGVLRPVDGPPLAPSLFAYLRIFELSMVAVRAPETVLRAHESMVLGGTPWERQVFHEARCEALTWLGRYQEAAEAASEALDHVQSDAEPWALSGIAIDARGVSALADEVERARAVDDETRVRAALAEADRFLEDGRTRARLGRPRRAAMGPEGRAWLRRLDLEEARCQGQDTAEAWLELARQFECLCVFEALRARWRAARLLVQAGTTGKAAEQIRLVFDGAQELGADPLLKELEDLAARAGIASERVGAQNSSPRRSGVGGSSSREGPVSGPPPVLTRREHEVMTLVAEGLTNRAVGVRLHISEKTVSVHISNVLGKLGASGRTEAVAVLGRLGLIG